MTTFNHPIVEQMRHNDEIRTLARRALGFLRTVDPDIDVQIVDADDRDAECLGQHGAVAVYFPTWKATVIRHIDQLTAEPIVEFGFSVSLERWGLAEWLTREVEMAERDVDRVVPMLCELLDDLIVCTIMGGGTAEQLFEVLGDVQR